MLKKQDKITLMGLFGFLTALFGAMLLGKALINKDKEEEILRNIKKVVLDTEGDVTSVRCHKPFTDREDDHVVFKFINIKFRTAETQITSREFIEEFLKLDDVEEYRLLDKDNKPLGLDVVVNISDFGTKIVNITTLKKPLKLSKKDTEKKDPSSTVVFKPINITIYEKTFEMASPHIMAGDLFFEVLGLNEDEYYLTRNMPDCETEGPLDLESWLHINDLQRGYIHVVSKKQSGKAEVRPEGEPDPVVKKKTKITKSSATIKELLDKNLLKWKDPKEDKTLKPRILVINGAPHPVYRTKMTGLEIKTMVIDFRRDYDEHVWILYRVFEKKDGQLIADDFELVLKLGTEYKFRLETKNR